ncbi:hypothetical protein ACFXPZ_14225 [Streptomyces sp. NPDC059101]|uniref:hypothetical protein n=1 Tax=unclassified Streptomyces TaxID=2593676 RepID=UPI000C280515|nr:hypothetical protein [Streptomyces sp. CB02959]PJN36616.1 hypothetical protein CG747_32275 [Streptomyces sp. CB02959]
MQQGTHHFVLTLQQQTPGGAIALATFANGCTPQPGQTRADVYADLLEAVTYQDPALKGANVIFFALERNEL